MQKTTSSWKKMTVACASASLLLISAGTSFAQNGNSQGANNGQPFQQLQEAIDAASDAAQSAIDANSAAIDANSSAIASNSAAITAEEAARMAADAALQAALAAEAANWAAQLAAEEAARISGDEALADAIAQEEAERNAELELIGERVAILEGYHEAPTHLQYTETSGYDLMTFRTDMSALDFQPGDWFFWGSFDAARNRNSGICTDSPQAYNAVVNFVNRTSSTLVYGGASSWTLRSGAPNWVQGQTNRFITTNAYIRVLGSGIDSVLIDRNTASTAEVWVSGYRLGNTADIMVGATRMDACGF